MPAFFSVFMRLSDDRKNHPRAGLSAAVSMAMLVCASLPLAQADIPLSVPGLTADQASVLSAFQQACPSATGDLAVRCQQLGGLDTASLKAAVINLTPYQFLPQTGLPLRLWPKQVYDRSKQRELEGWSLSALDDAHTGMSGAAAGEHFRDGPLSLILQGKYQAGKKSIPRGGFNGDSYELTLGADYRLSDNWVLGGAMAYNRTDVIMDFNAGAMRSNIYRVMLFGDYHVDGLGYLNWLGIYSDYDNDIQRQYQYGSFNGNANSNPDARLYGATVTLGKDFNVREWVFNPFFRVEYAHLRVDAYREQATPGFAYEVAAQTDESVTSIIGAQVSHTMSLPWGVLTPSLRFEYEHQFLNDNRKLALRLADAPTGSGTFFLNTGRPDRDYYNLGGSLALGLGDGLSAFLHYESRLGQAKLMSHLVEFGVRVPF